MKHISLPIFVALAISCAANVSAEPPAPDAGEARTIDQLIDAIRQGEPDSRRVAMMELADRPDDALPALPTLRDSLADKDADVRAMAAIVLGVLRLEPDATIPALIGMLDDEADSFAGDVSIVAGQSLGRFGKAALPHLTKAIQQESMRVKYGAGVGLYELGPDAAEAVPLLIPLTGHADEKLRRLVVAIFREIGPPAKEAVPVLIQSLSHEDFHTQYWACRALGAIGEASGPAIPVLLERLTDGTASVRRNAAAALGDIGPTVGQASVDALTKAIGDVSQPVREQAVIALGKLAPLSQSSIPAIEQALEGGSSKLAQRSAAARTLWILKPDSPLIKPVLLEELACHEREPWAAAEVLAEIGPKLDAVQDVIAVLENPSPEVRSCAADALGGMGPAAAAAVPALQALLTDENEDARQAAQDALEQIAPSSTEAKP